MSESWECRAEVSGDASGRRSKPRAAGKRAAEGIPREAVAWALKASQEWGGSLYVGPHVVVAMNVSNSALAGAVESLDLPSWAVIVDYEKYSMEIGKALNAVEGGPDTVHIEVVGKIAKTVKINGIEMQGDYTLLATLPEGKRNFGRVNHQDLVRALRHFNPLFRGNRRYLYVRVQLEDGKLQMTSQGARETRTAQMPVSGKVAPDGGLYDFDFMRVVETMPAGDQVTAGFIRAGSPTPVPVLFFGGDHTVFMEVPRE